MITIDTSGMLALVDPRQRRHEETKICLLADPGPLIVPAGAMCEIGYHLAKRGGTAVLDSVLTDILEGAFSLDCGDEDFQRIRELLDRYADLHLGFTDAAVIACAERHGGRVLTLDRRDFDVVAREGRITILPA